MTFLEENTLANGLQLTIHDKSRPLAGDRWLVELCCTAVYPLSEELTAGLVEPDAELRGAILERLGQHLEFTVIRSRQFIDERDKDAVLAELLAGVKEHMLVYFAKPHFPQRLFHDTCRKLREECRLEQIRFRSEPEDAEDDGPADFSALFRGDTIR